MTKEFESPKLLLMVDVESLDLGPRPVLTQIAMLGYDLEQDEMLKTEFVEYFPIQPQIDMARPRTISASTLIWWMMQSDEARARFQDNIGDDPFDLQWLAKSFVDTFRKMTANYPNYVICAKGPQFDLVAIETLLLELDLEVPWDYWRVDDLRTLMRQAKLSPDEVPTPEGFIHHVAYWDARWQIEQYLVATRGFVPQLVDAKPSDSPKAALPNTDPQRALPIKS